MMDKNEIAAALQRQFGLDPEDAKRAAGRVLEVQIIESRMAARTPVAIAKRLDSLSDEIAPANLALQNRIVLNGEFPIRLTIPWSGLVSDNKKYAPAYTRGGSPRLVLQHDYREAKKKAARIARTVMAGREPIDAVPLELYARVWVPDRRRGHDTANFAKCLCDALEGIVYANDEWLHRTVWERAGVDVDRPRAEVEIRPFVQTATAMRKAS